MKSMFQRSLALMRAQPNASCTPRVADPTLLIKRALRDAGLLSGASTTSATEADGATPGGGAALDGTCRVVEVHAASTSAVTEVPGTASFRAGQFALGGASRDYRLFVPAGFAGERLPLIVMLHGCTQNADDFARGTRMNLLAQASGALVLYPAQAARSNSSRCWNWFQPGDQRRDAGEPALLAGMTRNVIATHQIDPRRVHVAGLSAGGAMAAILGREYPDLYASVGVHSGLAPGAAHDIPSAFAAMKSAPTGLQQLPRRPVIAFHGDKDKTVHPRNGEQVVGVAGSRTSSRVDGAGRGCTRTLIRNAEGYVRAEHWLVHGAGHAWSGGSSEGSYADPQGPDASREMLRFFAEHPLV